MNNIIGDDLHLIAG